VLDRLRELRLLLEERVVVRAAVDEMRDLRVPAGGGVPVHEPFGRHLARVRLRPKLGLLGEVRDAGAAALVDDAGVVGLRSPRGP